MDYLEALRWLRTLPDFERTGEFAARPDVQPVRALLAALGDPQAGRPTIHIAGSKGKGSTAVIAESILRAAGRATGCYVSPHLHRYTERVRIGGEPVAPERFAAALASVRKTLPRITAEFPGRTFVAFDALTAAAFLAFRDAASDTQIVEVGLGGALDSTNVFDSPDIVVLTPISLEHTSILGDSIGAIAREKAGIIKRGARVIVAPQRESALDVFRAVAEERGAGVVEVAQTCQMTRTSASSEGQEFRLRTPRADYRAQLPLLGRHQLDNAAAAILACEELAERHGFDVTPQIVRQALAGVSWPGRIEVLRRRPLVVVDGAHNGDSTRRLVEALREHLGVTRATVLFGTLADKDVDAIAAAVAPLADAIFVAQWPHPRAHDVTSAAMPFRQLDAPVFVLDGLPRAFEAAAAHAGERGAVIALGAIAFAASVREYLLGIESDIIRLALAPGPPPP